MRSYWNDRSYLGVLHRPQQHSLAGRHRGRRRHNRAGTDNDHLLEARHNGSELVKPAAWRAIFVFNQEGNVVRVARM
ncbi:hypothetical protein IF1G_05441 [Cordyceps javanica]|uniref:Uncharacterized protein n=1 Tax=Cordyceps javanica TaxID=43265 RepID=A0A545VZU7_9HYPO|nr:hypothetical protein IF1G_05441 [Cordyceps javanica]TQW07185.1 hypothetical protein IF2G_05569 [Cordyceps javanica]